MSAETEMERRWLRLAEANSQPKPRETWKSLHRLYSAPDRAYHNLGHIRACLGWLEKVANDAQDPLSLEFTIWFHDAIYDTHARDNEAQSADFAVSSLAAPIRVERVRDLILATQHREAAEGDAGLICDIDLAILGSDSDAYHAYRGQIREEYGWVPDAEFFVGRIQVLRLFLSRPAIFATAPFRHLESAARRNLEAEIRALGG